MTRSGKRLSKSAASANLPPRDKALPGRLPGQPVLDVSRRRPQKAMKDLRTEPQSPTPRSPR
jgi:hypothetical protein